MVHHARGLWRRPVRKSQPRWDSQSVSLHLLLTACCCLPDGFDRVPLTLTSLCQFILMCHLHPGTVSLAEGSVERKAIWERKKLSRFRGVMIFRIQHRFSKQFAHFTNKKMSRLCASREDVDHGEILCKVKHEGESWLLFEKYSGRK